MIKDLINIIYAATLFIVYSDVLFSLVGTGRNEVAAGIVMKIIWYDACYAKSYFFHVLLQLCLAPFVSGIDLPAFPFTASSGIVLSFPNFLIR